MARFSRFTRIVGLAAASLWMSGLAGPVSAATARPPNILFFFVDDTFLRETKAGMTIDKATNQPVEYPDQIAATAAAIRPSAKVPDSAIAANLLTTDNHGQVTGIRGGGALWISQDGRKFNLDWT